MRNLGRWGMANDGAVENTVVSKVLLHLKDGKIQVKKRRRVVRGASGHELILLTFSTHTLIDLKVFLLKIPFLWLLKNLIIKKLDNGSCIHSLYGSGILCL